jgi:hypothetical protein
MTPGLVERAYQLAKEGRTIAEIRTELKNERYSDIQGQLDSRTLLKDLRRLSRLAKPMG